MATEKTTYPERHRAYRERLRARGMRPLVLWVPDTRLPGFEAEMERQRTLVEGDPADREDLELIEAVADWSD
jgi:hypothetical protein